MFEHPHKRVSELASPAQDPAEGSTAKLPVIDKNSLLPSHLIDALIDGSAQGRSIHGMFSRLEFVAQ
jgi:hypothetical protein